MLMKKSERLTDMMLFLNDKNSFQLSELMSKYNISRSTAIRDIKSLEEIGMPIYSQLGRNGYYGLLQNRLLSPIVFNMEEVFALYFAMLTLKAYETTPFHLSVEKLKKKFETCLAEEKITMLRQIENVFSLSFIQHNNQCEFLDVILRWTIEEQACEIAYKKNGDIKNYLVQFFNISSAHGQWYGTSYNFETESTQVFRCDKIVAIKVTNKYLPKSLADLKRKSEELYQKKAANNFEVEITTKGIDLFYKEHYPSMELHIENGKNIIRGFYHHAEETFIINYLLGYGTNILAIKPKTLKPKPIQRLNFLKTNLEQI